MASHCGKEVSMPGKTFRHGDTCITATFGPARTRSRGSGGLRKEYMASFSLTIENRGRLNELMSL